MVARFHYEDVIYQQLLDDQLPRQEQKDVTRHLEECSQCQSKLETLAERGIDWSELQQYLKPIMPPIAKEQANQDSIWIGFLEPSERPDSLGRFGRYEILEVLGRGGTGIVMRGYDPSLDRQSAIKVLSPELAASAAARKRFSREAKSAAAVVHEHVVPIQTVDEEQGIPYLVMPVLEGRSLEERVRQQGPLDVKEVLRIGRQIASGLAAAHAQGLVHRDVKPANILQHTGVERVVITDFGLARAVDDASMTQSGMLVGTPQYMSPEQARGETLDARSDLFSLGSVLYFLCVGHSPFRAETTMGVLSRITRDNPRSLPEQNPDIPEWLDQIIRRLLSKDAEDRYQTAAEVESLLGKWLAHLQDPTGKSRPSEPPEASAGRGNFRRRNLVLAALGGFALAWAGIFVMLETNKGTLTIQSDSDDVAVRITQGEEVAKQLTVVKGDNQVRLAAGQYVVEIEGEHDGLSIENGEVTLTRGDRKLVHIVESSTKPVPAGERLFQNLGVGPKGNEIGVPLFSDGEEGLIDSINQTPLSPGLAELVGRWIPTKEIGSEIQAGNVSEKARLQLLSFDRSKNVAIQWSTARESEGKLRINATRFEGHFEVAPHEDEGQFNFVFTGRATRPAPDSTRVILRGIFRRSDDQLSLTISEAENPPRELGFLPVTWELTPSESEGPVLNLATPARQSPRPHPNNYRAGEALPFHMQMLQGYWTVVSDMREELKRFNDPLASVRIVVVGRIVGYQVVDPKQNVVYEVWGEMNDRGEITQRSPGTGGPNDFDFGKLQINSQSDGRGLTFQVNSDELTEFRSMKLPATWMLKKGVLVRDATAEGNIAVAQPNVELGKFQLFSRSKDNTYYTYSNESGTWHRYQWPESVMIQEITMGDPPTESGKSGIVGFEHRGGGVRELVAVDMRGNFRPYPLPSRLGRAFPCLFGQGGTLYHLVDHKLYAFSGVSGTWDVLDVPQLEEPTRDGAGNWKVPAYDTGFHPDEPEGIEVEFDDHRQLFTPESGKWERLPLEPKEDIQGGGYGAYGSAYRIMSVPPTNATPKPQNSVDNKPAPSTEAFLGTWSSEDPIQPPTPHADRGAVHRQIVANMDSQNKLIMWVNLMADDLSDVGGLNLAIFVTTLTPKENPKGIRADWFINGLPSYLEGTYELDGEHLTITWLRGKQCDNIATQFPEVWKMRRGTRIPHPDKPGTFLFVDPDGLNDVYQLYHVRNENAYATYCRKDHSWDFHRFPAELKIGHAAAGLRFDPITHEQISGQAATGFHQYGDNIKSLVAIDTLGKFHTFPLERPFTGQVAAVASAEKPVIYFQVDGTNHAFSGSLGNWDSIDCPNAPESLTQTNVVVRDMRIPFPKGKNVFNELTGKWELAQADAVVERHSEDNGTLPPGPANESAVGSRSGMTKNDTEPQPNVSNLSISTSAKGLSLFQVRISNAGKTTLRNVKVEETIDPNLRVLARTYPSKDSHGKVVWTFSEIPAHAEVVLEVQCEPTKEITQATNQVKVTVKGIPAQTVTIQGRPEKTKRSENPSLKDFDWTVPCRTPDALQGIWQNAGEKAFEDNSKNYVPLGLLISRDTLLARDTPIPKQPEVSSEKDHYIQGRWEITPNSDDPNNLRGTFEWTCTDKPYDIIENPDRPLKKDESGAVLADELIKRKRRLKGTYEFKDNRLTLTIQEANDPPDFLGKLPVTWTFQGPPEKLPPEKPVSLH